MVFTALCLFIFCLIIAQEIKKQNKYPLKAKSKEELFQKSLDSLIAKSKNFVLSEKWDSFYRCQIYIFTLAKNYNQFSSIVNLIEENINKIPKEKYLLHSKGDFLNGSIHGKIGNIFEAEFYNQKVINSFHLHKDSILQLKAYNQSGIFRIKTRDFSNAIHLLLKAKLISRALNDTINLAKNLENLGIAYLWSGHYEKARLALIQSRFFEADPNRAMELEISRSYLFEGRYDEAFIQGNLALKKSIESKNQEIQYLSLTNIASIYVNKNNYNLAINYYNKALQLRSVIEDKREIVKTLLPLAQVKLKLNKPNEALALIDEAIALLGYNRKIENGKALPSEMYLIELFTEKANCYLAKNKIKPHIDWLKQAEINFEKSIEVLTDMRQYHDNPGTIEALSKDAKSIFEKSIANSLTQYELIKDKKYLDHAFVNVQKYGSFNLRKNISERKALDLAVLDAKTKNDFLKAKVDFLNEEYKLNAEFSEDGFKTYNDAKTRFQYLRDSLEKNNKRFRKLSQNINYVHTKDIQKKLATDEVFIQYFTGVDEVIVLSIYKNDITYHKLDNDQKFKSNLQQYLSLLSDPASSSKKSNQDSIRKAYGMASLYLYRSLVEPSVKNKAISKITMVPDGAFFRIPFDAFTTVADASWTDASAYLLSKYTIDYLYYAAQYQKDEVKEYEDYFVGIGLEYDKYTLESMKEIKQDTTLHWIKDKFRSESLSHLYFADDEVKEVAKHFGGKTFLNDKATKSNLMQTIHKAGILHISAHSCVDFTTPEHSAIVLSKSVAETDNLIKYDDIAEQDLNSQMVILSSCSSSSGKISEAEGVSSLSKAFFEAGSQSVVGSYWSVPDEVSKLFMELFYKKLSEGKAKDVALREVKLEFISNNSIVNPYYQQPKFWAAWSLYGDVEPLKVSPFRWWWVAVGLGFVTIVFFGFRFRKNL